MLRTLIFWSPVLVLGLIALLSLIGVIGSVAALACMVLVLVGLHTLQMQDLRDRVRGLERRWPSSEG